MSTPVPPAPSGGVQIASSTLVIFAFLLVGLGWGIGYGITFLAHELRVAFVPPPQIIVSSDSHNIPPELELRYQILKNQLDNAAENSKQIDRLITLLLTLTSLYALALGLSSYFGLKQILENGKDELAKLTRFLTESREQLRDKLGEADTQAQRKLTEVDTKVASELSKAETQLTEFRAELREKYPELANLHDNLREIVAEMRLMFPTGRDWTKEYNDLTAGQREKFGVAEMRIVGLDIFGLRDFDPLRQEIRQVYHGLGRFYSSQYSAGKNRPSWERASLHFETAVRLPVKPMAELLKDQGVHFTLIEQMLDARVAAGAKATPEEIREVEAFRFRAERAFSESLAENPVEPGALFGLAWVYYKQKRYSDAIVRYDALTKITQWAAGDRQKFLEDAYLNEACCYSLSATADQNDRAYAPALECLRESKKAAADYNRAAEWILKVEKESELANLARTHAGDLNTILA